MGIKRVEITVINAYKDSRNNPLYQKIYLKGVVWEFKKGFNKMASGYVSDNNCDVIIPELVEADNDKKFIEPTQFQRLSDKSGYWTLAESDRLVLGRVEGDITSISDIDNNYSDSGTISSVFRLLNTNPNLQHWELILK